MQSYCLHIVLKDGTDKLSTELGDLEFVDRLAKECMRDPQVASATAVLTAKEQSQIKPATATPSLVA